MNIFVCDLSEDKKRRWSEVCPGCVPVDLVGSKLVVESDLTQSASNGVVIAHRMLDDLNAADAESLFDWAAGNSLIIVIVSGSGSAPAPGDPPHVYRRRRGVGSGTDERFAVCFAKFREAHAQTGTVRFELLEPPAWPEALVAVYIAARATTAQPSICELLTSSPAWATILASALHEFPDVIAVTTLTPENASTLSERILLQLESRAIGNP